MRSHVPDLDLHGATSAATFDRRADVVAVLESPDRRDHLGPVVEHVESREFDEISGASEPSFEEGVQFNWLTTWIYEGVYFAPMNVYTMGESDFFDGFDLVRVANQL